MIKSLTSIFFKDRKDRKIEDQKIKKIDRSRQSLKKFKKIKSLSSVFEKEQIALKKQVIAQKNVFLICF